jgi:glucose/arabinose dehydrogenase
MMNILNPILVTFLFARLLSCGGDKKIDGQHETKNPQNEKQGYNIEVVAEELKVPWSIVFTDSNRILINERPGRMRVIQDGRLMEQPLHVFSEVSSQAEEGLMGLTLHPEYKSNKLLYISCAYEKNGDLFVKIVRFKDEGSKLSEEKVILDNIPGAKFHAGCRLRFGPDGKLYITTGDATERDLAQELNRLEGKILRLNPDGTIPTDNPFPNSPVWSYGHRNPQGIDWFPGTEILYETEHGPSGFDGPGGGDEVNIIFKGKNYGWPIVHHREHKDGMEDPVLEFTPAEAPASGMFYRSGAIAEFKNNFFFGCLRGEGIMRVVVDEKDPVKILSFEKLGDVNYGRIRDIAEGPDGAIYFSTSNRDGRGRIREGDDKIYRISPK